MNFRNAVYTKEYKFTDSDGIDQVVILKPLPVKFLPKVLNIAGHLNVGKDGEVDERIIMDMFKDEKASNDLVLICDETMKKSYPSIPDEEREEFVSSHFSSLFPLVLELNLGSAKKNG